MAPNCNQFFVFLSQPHSSLTLFFLCLLLPSAQPALSFYPQSTQFHSFWFRSELIRAWPGLGRVSFVRSLIRSGWLAGVTPCNRNLHPESHYLHFNSTRLSPPPLPPPLPNGGYKHKYEFKGPQMTISRITSRTILCILIRSGYRGLYRFLFHLRTPRDFGISRTEPGLNRPPLLPPFLFYRLISVLYVFFVAQL